VNPDLGVGALDHPGLVLVDRGGGGGHGVSLRRFAYGVSVPDDCVST
jgi:hypothetical protein